MATDHFILPGSGDLISNLPRVQAFGYPLDRKTLLQIAQNARLPTGDLAIIRMNARRLWSYPQEKETSYGNHFIERPAAEKTTLRPTSPTRRSKPHPSTWFLTNQLHYIPGYHKPNAILAKEAYKVDASLSPTERDERRAVRRKYSSRQDDRYARVNSYSDPHGFKQKLKDDRAAQAAEAWLRIADDKDRNVVLNVAEKDVDDDQKQQADGGPVYSSAHRWKQLAEANDVDAVGRIVQTLESDPDRYYQVLPEMHYNQTLLSERMRDIESAGRFRFPGTPSRGDFLIHPDWPPTLAHHRIP